MQPAEPTGETEADSHEATCLPLSQHSEGFPSRHLDQATGGRSAWHSRATGMVKEGNSEPGGWKDRVGAASRKVLECGLRGARELEGESGARSRPWDGPGGGTPKMTQAIPTQLPLWKEVLTWEQHRLAGHCETAPCFVARFHTPAGGLMDLQSREWNNRPFHSLAHSPR